MKITNIKIEKFTAPLEEPFHVAFGVTYDSESWTVKISTDEGIYGIGSACPCAYVTGETMETCYLVLQMFAKALIGCDPLDIAGIHHKMDSLIHGNGSAKCAIDLALHDIAGKHAGLPVYKLLGGTNPVVHNDITIGISSLDQMVSNAQTYVFDMGFRILKVKIGNDLEHDLCVLRAIRKLVGPDIRIRIDANQGYDIPTALEAMKAFEEIGIDAAEQFLPWWDFDGAAELKRRNTSSLKLMLDESIHDVYDAKRAFQMNCADYYNIKLMKCGGLYWGSKIADFADQHDVKCMVGCMIENKISLVAGVSLVAAKNAIVEADCDSFLLFKGHDDGIKGGFTCDGGVFTLLDKPGFGIDLNI